MDERLEAQLEEISRNEFLEMENLRLVQQIKQMAGRLKRHQERETRYKRIIGKQNKLLQQFGEKEYYVNIQKGIPKKRRYRQ